jgi:signal transduction histidine kinase
MSDPVRPAVHRSVFVKLVLVMMLMAVCLMGLVVAFFALYVAPRVGASVDRVLGDYASRIAAEEPDLARARQLGARLALQVRYEGPRGAWTTDDSLPTIATALAESHGSRWLSPAWGHGLFLLDAPGGGHYLFAWDFGRRARAAHDRMLVLLLALMLGVFLVAHVVLRRGLRPLRALQDGVARLSAGDLDVALPIRGRDEFAVLTDGFNRMAARVREMVRARDQLLQDVSHELRSPLTRLKVALALLPESRRRAQAEADAAEMEALIAELLEFERLRDGRALRTSPCDLVRLVRDAALPYVEGQPGVRVSTAQLELTAVVDPDEIRTVLRNLLGNAVKFSLPDSRPVEIEAHVEGAAAVVRVVDDGPGVPEPDLASVFEPFFRVDRSRSRRTGGYGLGLSICRRIVEAHGGTLVAGNNPGRGACFTLRLPLGGVDGYDHAGPGATPLDRLG